MNEDDDNVCRIELSKKEYETLLKWSEHGETRTLAIFHDLMNVDTNAHAGMWLNRYDEVLAVLYDVRLGRFGATIAMHDLGLNASVIGRLDQCNSFEKLEIKSIDSDYKEN